MSLRPDAGVILRPVILAVACAAAGAVLFTLPGQVAPAGETITVQAGRPGAAIARTMFGVFFEDINFAADGGLYPERVKNRSFEFTEPLAAWARLNRTGDRGELDVRSDGGLSPNNPHYLRVRNYDDGAKMGLANEGFRFMGFQSGAEYVFSAYVRSSGSGSRQLRAVLVNERRAPLAEATLTGFTNKWKKYEVVLRSSATTSRGQLNLFVEGRGDLDLDMVSLYPKDTWKNRPNGLRRDLVQLLADLHPGFIRFPGGCIVEGRRLELRYQWKKTVGDVSERRTLINRWNNEFNQKPAPDYFQSFGLGFYEYFQLAEDIGAEPLPIMNCGMACQFNSGETAGMDKIDEYVQDALDLIEFANGSAGSRWGSLRARMGHPAPFNLKMLGVGNEQWGPQYLERYKRFSAKITSRYPGIMLIASSGPGPDGKLFDALWSSMRELKADIVDEHYYAAPSWFLQNAGRYDKYDRNGPKVFAGEYAAQTVGVARPENRNNWEAAIAEAAFMTGLERNAEVVRMASYAPLLAHVDAWQWTPNEIWFDNLRSYGTPNYYVQKLYSTNLGTDVLPVLRNGSAQNPVSSIYTSASLDRKTREVVVKAVNISDSPKPVRLEVAGVRSVGVQAKLTVLASNDLKVENSLDAPTRIAPADRSVTGNGSGFTLTLEPRSFTVLRTQYVQ